MRKLESLKALKIMLHIESLNSFKVYKSNIDGSLIFASCFGDYENSIFVSYDIDKKSYHLSVNCKSAVYKKFDYIFTQEFSQQVFEAIQTIYLRKECEKND